MEWSFGPLSNVRAPTGHSTRKIRIAEKIYDTFGLSPEDMADRINRSAPGDKWAVYHFIDGSSVLATRQRRLSRNSGVLVRPPDLDLKGAAFNGLGKPETFTFLGFTFICSYLQQNASGQIPNQTEVPAGPHAGKVASHQTGIATEHQPIPQQGRWLQQVVTGYFNTTRCRQTVRH